MILGIDEVGRGPWAGPLVVGAVVLGGAQIDGLTDSKKLTKKKREELDVIIHDQAQAIGLGWVSANEIDEIGLSESLRLATRRSVEQINVPYHEIIIDGTINFLADTSKGRYVTTLKKADLLIPSVSAASIVAKVARDRYMLEQDSVYPGYGFKSHVGYGTAAHVAAIDKLGVTSLHRLSFAPLAKYASATKNADSLSNGISSDVTTRQIGDSGEDAAANELVRRGHEVLERNWKTKYCEIDIVSTINGVLYFTEVKQRKDVSRGGGMAAISDKKLAQMKFAAKFYAHTHKLTDRIDLRLVAVATSGQPADVIEYLEIT
ncbi:MAG: ribonuclease HII [Candidatus Saccharimonadaceae bacterium]